MSRKIDCLCIHHTASAHGDAASITREHTARGFSTIGYHGLILPDGVFQQGRPEEQVGAGVFGANTGLLHVALVGNFHKPDAGYTGPPSRAQLDTLGEWLLNRNWRYAGRFARPALECAGHNEVALKTHPTACPGSEFPMAAVRRWFEHYSLTWRPGDTPSVSLGAFVERGGALALLDEVTRLTETPKRLRVQLADGKGYEVPRDDWEIRQGQTWVRLRPFCTALGAEVAGTAGAGREVEGLMVGGIVKETLSLADRIWVNVEHATEAYRDECAIYVVQNETSLRIRPGDALWWQGRDAMWTPQENRAEECGHREHVTCNARCGVDYDIRIPRLGFSGVRHPAQAMVEAAYAGEAMA